MSVTSAIRGFRVAALALLACATVGMMGASCDDSPTPDESATGSPAPATPVKGAKAPGGGEIKVVESGVSMATDGRGDSMATYGALLENTSRDHVAYDAEIIITLLDASGQPVSDRNEKATRVTRILRFAAPQQRIGLGQYVYVDRGNTVASVKVEIGESWWLPTSAARIAQLTTSGLTATAADGGKAVAIRFTVDNGYPVAIKRVAMAVLRDGAGKIVGGTGPEEERQPNGDYAPGRSQGEIRSIGGPPRGVDLGRTEVFVYPTPEAFRIR